METPAPLVDAKLPVCVYVVFHPESKEGPALAEAVFRWLRLKDDVGDGTSAGLAVYYRASIRDGAISPPIAYDGTHHNMLVLLVDDAMATDPAWRDALRKLVGDADTSGLAWRAELEARRKDPDTHVEPKPRVHLLPVMVSMSFNPLVFLSARHNPVRIYSASDPEVFADRVALRAQRLRRHLTEAMVRELRQLDPAVPPPRLKVFISHAKTDGVHIATRIRDGLASVSQFEPWFDVNDLPPGHKADDRMALAAGASTGGMIAVLTDAYPTRPWCRYEAQLARTPQPSAELPRYFQVQPTVAVSVAGNKWSRAVGPMAQVHRVGWPNRPEPRRPTDHERKVDPLGAAEVDGRHAAEQDLLARDEDARIAQVVDRLLLEVLLAEVMGLVARTYPENDHLLLGFLPDAWTLTAVRARLDADGRAAPGLLAYPGHGLRRAERDELERVTKVLFGPARGIVPFEELLLGCPPPVPDEKPRPIVALSAGGTDAELWPVGIGMAHANDLVVRLTRQLLIHNYRVAYGGTLTADDKLNLTQAVFDAAEGWRADLDFDIDHQHDDARVRRGDDALERPPVLNYAAWPSSDHIDLERRGRYLGLCEFVLVDPPVAGDRPFDALGKEDRDANATRFEADALTRMRTRMAEECDVRVLYGGKIHHWRGWLPGIAEELSISIRKGRPTLLLGGFGGCARLLASFFAAPDAPWPPELTYDAELAERTREVERLKRAAEREREAARRRGAEPKPASPSKPEEWSALGVSEADRKAKFTELQTELVEARRKIHASEGDIFGVPRRAWMDGLVVTNQTKAIKLVLETLAELKRLPTP